MDAARWRTFPKTRQRAALAYPARDEAMMAASRAAVNCSEIMQAQCAVENFARIGDMRDGAAPERITYMLMLMGAVMFIDHCVVCIYQRLLAGVHVPAFQAGEVAGVAGLVYAAAEAVEAAAVAAFDGVRDSERRVFDRVGHVVLRSFVDHVKICGSVSGVHASCHEKRNIT